MNAKYLSSFLNNGTKVDWFDINGSVYGYSNITGIIDTEGFEIPMIDASIAIAILSGVAANRVESLANIFGSFN